jgi:N,N-dimethylformamidase
VPPNLGGDQNDRVRADLAFAELPHGGAVFSVSSIAWCGSLSHNGYDNNVSRITANVLNRLVKPEPFA